MAPLTSYLVETLLTLLAVLGLAVIAIMAARRVGVGRPSGPMRLVGRMPLEARRGLYLVQIGDLVYVIGSSEAGLVKLGEIDAQNVPLDSDAGVERSFSQILLEKVRDRTAQPSGALERGTRGRAGKAPATPGKQGTGDPNVP